MIPATIPATRYRRRDTGDEMAANRNFPGGTVAMRTVGAAFVARSASVVGDVTRGADTSVWPFTCIGGDVAPIRVGAYNSNAASCSTLHSSSAASMMLRPSGSRSDSFR